MTAPRPTVLVTVLVVAIALAVVAVDRLLPPPEPAADGHVDAATDRVGGTWTCPVGDARAGSATSLLAVGSGDEPGRIELGTFGDGDLDLGEAGRVRAGAAAGATLEGGAGDAAFAHVYDGPVALHREWRLDGEEDVPPGIAAGPCVAESSDRWLVPGMSTAGGYEARLRLANPYETDATVAIRLVTPEGPVEPTVLQNLTVQGRSTTEIEVNEHLPERDDVAAEVHVLSGRMAVEGYQLVRQAIGDVDGVSLLSPAATPSTTWTVPWVAETGERQSWLWLLNPGDRPAPVELTMHTTDGGVVPEGLAEVTVEPGQLRRIDLRGTFPEDVESGAITARSEGVPVVVSGVLRQEADDAADTGVAVQLGARADTSWVLSGTGNEDRFEQVRLVNPGSEPASVDVALWDGESTRTPEELSGIEVPAGALVTANLGAHLEDAGQWAAIVTATEGRVIAGRVGLGGDEGLDLVAGVGSPGVVWERSGAAVAGRGEPGLTQRTGTGLLPGRD